MVRSKQVIMRLLINSSADDRADKASLLCLIMRNLRQFSLDVVVIVMSSEKLYMQGLDGSHVCLFEVELDGEWFDDYSYESGTDDSTIAISPALIDKALNTRQANQSVEISHDSGFTDLVVKLTGGGKDAIDKTFDLPLSAAEGYETMTVPEQEYDVDLTIGSKRFATVVDQLGQFSNNVYVVCSEEHVVLRASGDGGTMSAEINVEDEAVSYAITEELELTQSFSLRFLRTMTSFHGLCDDVVLGWGDDKPMTVKYDLGEKSRVQFFMAPRVN